MPRYGGCIGMIRACHEDIEAYLDFSFCYFCLYSAFETSFIS